MTNPGGAYVNQYQLAGAISGVTQRVNAEQNRATTAEQSLQSQFENVPNVNGLNTWSGDQYFKSGHPWFDIRAFGATGNGTTDDTTAIQQAITVAANSGGGTVFFSEGSYSFSSFAVPAGVNLIGSGKPYVTLLQTGAGITASSQWYLQQFCGLTLSSANLATNETNMMYSSYGAAWCTFDLNFLVHPVNITTAVFELAGSSNGENNRLDRVLIQPSTGNTFSCYGIFLAGTGTNSRINSTTIISPVINGATDAINITASQSTCIIQASFGNIASNAVHLVNLSGDTGCVKTTIIGGYFDSSISGNYLNLENDSTNQVSMCNVLFALGLDDLTHISLSGTGATDIGYSVYGANGVFSSYSSSTSLSNNMISGATNSGFYQLWGGPTAPQGRIIAAGETFAGGINAVSNNGGISSVMADQSSAEARVVKTANGSAYTQCWAWDRYGHQYARFTGTPTYAASGSNATSVSGSGNDVRGTINFTTAASLSAGAAVVTVTFVNAYASAPNVFLTPITDGAGAAALPFVTSIGTSGFTINLQSPPASATAMVISFQVCG